MSTAETTYYWIAINGPSVAANLSVPVSSVKVTPTPQSLVGFPTREEASEAQRFLLNAPIEDIPAQLVKWQKRDEIKIIIQPHPEPPTRGATQWELNPKSYGDKEL